ncbi:MAG TPA: rhomboid family intramembrane serine protease [Candidatus Acidoferrum sp.]|nr:rhomboid family intramembrane serine protease [Candidatus Acidoferrum sp.]
MGSFSRGYGYQFNLSGYFPRAVKTICLACVGVFLLQELSLLFFRADGWNFWTRWFGLIPADVLLHGYIWQPLTYLFLHGGLLHIFFNLLYLAMFGADLEHTWGRRKFYTYFFLCGIGAGLIDMGVRFLVVALGFAGPGLLHASTIGASGAIYGILLACAVVMPHRQVWFFPLPISLSMRLFVIVSGAIEFFLTIGATGDGVSHVCHLGGMLVGYLYLRRGSFLYNSRNFFSDWKRRRLRKKFEVYVREHRDKPPSRPDSWIN